jgi:hypothetical protein
MKLAIVDLLGSSGFWAERPDTGARKKGKPWERSRAVEVFR